MKFLKPFSALATATKTKCDPILLHHSWLGRSNREESPLIRKRVSGIKRPRNRNPNPPPIPRQRSSHALQDNIRPCNSDLVNFRLSSPRYAVELKSTIPRQHRYSPESAPRHREEARRAEEVTDKHARSTPFSKQNRSDPRLIGIQR
ncbi:hypothetical protein RRG08_051853 [Elysia crispata]|uniref:Uncharacterized protein n=1 Tax=Elysia crispata TaxID=231223 RepID=A0AAE0Z994_9GAST|nr:hypothetical protein RRG08_051853 [Elysia crispata]